MTPILPLGDRAFLARFDSEDQAARWAKAVRERRLRGVVDVVAAYQTVGVHADPDRADLDELVATLERVEPLEPSDARERLIPLPVLYDGEDLPEVAARLGLTPRQVIDAHSSGEYRVFAIGFLPGFPYAGDLPDALRGLPRRGSPRTRVPAGSLAIVGRQTGVYPTPSPGGWHLIGRTPLRIVDLGSGHFPIRVGDRIRFYPIDRDAFDERRGRLLS